MVKVQAAQAAPAADKEFGGPRSLMRLLGLFDVLAKVPDGLTLGELHLALDTPKSSLLNLLRPLVADAYLLHDGVRYRLGPAIFRMSADIMAGWNFSKVLRPFMAEISEATRETVYVGVLDHEEKVITYVDVIDSAQSVRYAVSVGQRRPLYCTAAGRVLLAYAPAGFVDDYLRTVKLEKRTEHTICSKKALREELARVRETGLAVSKGEWVVESAGIAVPVHAPDGSVIAALAVGAPIERLEQNFECIKEVLLTQARRLTGTAVEDNWVLPE